MNARTVERIAAGRRDVPPGLAKEVAARLREQSSFERHAATLRDRAAQLDVWVDEREADHGTRA